MSKQLEAFREGEQAHATGNDRTTNPYLKKKSLWIAWVNGYETAMFVSIATGGKNVRRN